MNNNHTSLAEFFSNIILSKHNQHVIILIVGSAGTGKSWASIQLASEMAKCISKKKGGVPEDYYSFEKNLAVMSKDEIKRIMSNPGEYGILHIDDAGVPLNSRKYMSDDNIDFNNILQTFRPNHNAVIITAQAGFLVDRVIRTIAHYIIEMEMNIFDAGITIAKVKKVVYKHTADKIVYPYIRIDGNRQVRCIFERPDKALTDRYETIRAEQLKKLSEKEALEQNEKVPPKITVKSISPKIKYLRNIAKLEFDEILDYVNNIEQIPASMGGIKHAYYD